ncbi:hypothetical protein [Nonomuraea sp. B19D2]|uniref:hypothetical protein n=1 Tax=Nonomuraea sp. B19D2 TaxID=3159561 RepID=UPI0032DBDFB4
MRRVQLTAAAHDKALALLPYFAGLRIDEVVGLDLADVRLSAHKGELRTLCQALQDVRTEGEVTGRYR